MRSAASSACSIRSRSSDSSRTIRPLKSVSEAHQKADRITRRMSEYRVPKADAPLSSPELKASDIVR
jgi:hypothetical protein